MSWTRCHWDRFCPISSHYTKAIYSFSCNWRLQSHKDIVLSHQGNEKIFRWTNIVHAAIYRRLIHALSLRLLERGHFSAHVVLFMINSCQRLNCFASKCKLLQVIALEFTFENSRISRQLSSKNSLCISLRSPTTQYSLRNLLVIRLELRYFSAFPKFPS